MRLQNHLLLLPLLLPHHTLAQFSNSKTLDDCKSSCSQNFLCELAVFFPSNRTCSQLPCASAINPSSPSSTDTWLKPDYKSRCPSWNPSSQNECIENCALDENCEAAVFAEGKCKIYDCKGSYFDIASGKGDGSNSGLKEKVWYKSGREQRCLGSTSGGVYPSGQVLGAASSSSGLGPVATAVSTGEVTGLGWSRVNVFGMVVIWIFMGSI